MVKSVPSIDFAKWELEFRNDETAQQVLKDTRDAIAYGVEAVPTLVINEENLLLGVKNTTELLNIFSDLSSL